MMHTHFYNPHGLPNEQQVTTARDMALLAQAAAHRLPRGDRPLYAQTQATIDKITIGTHNAMLTGFPGGDGIKDRLHLRLGLQTSSPAPTRDGHRVIAVVLGEESNNARTARAAALLENGFRTREWKSAFPIARVDNYPSEVVGAGFDPAPVMLERFRACKAPPPPPPNVTASAGDGIGYQGRRPADRQEGLGQDGQQKNGQEEEAPRAGMKLRSSALAA